MHAHFRRLFAYDDWANREEAKHLMSVDFFGLPSQHLLAHIVGTQWLWLSRLDRIGTPMAVWPELSLAQSAAQLDPLRDGWAAYLQSADLDETIRYVNSQGEEWTSRVDDVLTHVILHGSYHRGQIAKALREEGAKPLYTDYIHCTRSGFLTTPPND